MLQRARPLASGRDRLGRCCAQQVRPAVQGPATLGRGTGCHTTPPRTPMSSLPGDTSGRHRASHGRLALTSILLANPAPCKGSTGGGGWPTSNRCSAPPTHWSLAASTRPPYRENGRNVRRRCSPTSRRPADAVHYGGRRPYPQSRPVLRMLRHARTRRSTGGGGRGVVLRGRAEVLHCRQSDAEGTLSKRRKVQFSGNAEDEKEDSEENDDNEPTIVTPLEIATPIILRLDWWQDINLKQWAGSMSARNITLAMCRAINPDVNDPLNQSQVVSEVKEIANPTKSGRPPGAKPKEQFHFDARRGANALGRDIGFIHDTLKKRWKTPMFAHPVVEFFALIGLQRARGRSRLTRFEVYDYFTWTRSPALSGDSPLGRRLRIARRPGCPARPIQECLPYRAEETQSLHARHPSSHRREQMTSDKPVTLELFTCSLRSRSAREELPVKPRVPRCRTWLMAFQVTPTTPGTAPSVRRGHRPCCWWNASAQARTCVTESSAGFWGLGTPRFSVRSWARDEPAAKPRLPRLSAMFTAIQVSPGAPVTFPLSLWGHFPVC